MTVCSAPRAVLFDWDNTLVDTWPAIIAGVSEAFLEMGMEPWSEEECRSRIGHSMRDYFPHLFGERWEDAAKIFMAAFKRVHISMLRAIPGVEDALRELNKQNVYVAVVSNKTSILLREEVAHLGWGGYFACLVGSGDAEKDKPAPEAVLMALEGSGVVPSEEAVWFVGDHPIDMRCALASGCLPVLITSLPIAEEDLRQWPPGRRFGDFSEFWGELRNLTVPNGQKK